MQNHKTQNNGEYRNVSIAILQESPSNPRKRFHEESLKELAESFKSQGILQPLVVRTISGDQNKYEVVAGARLSRSRDGAPLGRNRYVELELRKARTQSQTAKANPAQKPCEKMTEAIVMDGGKRGQIVKVCADPSCRTHYGNRPSPQAMERERAEERKRIEKQKLAITIRHRILATTLERVSAPLKKADLLAVAQYLIAHLPYNQTPQLAKRRKVEVEKDGSPEQQLMKRISTYDEVALGRLMLEVSLLDSAYQRFGRNEEDALANAAKRYRVDTEKLAKAVAQEFAAKVKKQERKTATKKVVA
jgi:hypothetical protein